MKRRHLSHILTTVFVISSFLVLLGFSFFANAFSPSFYSAAFERYSVEENTNFSAFEVNEKVVGFVSRYDSLDVDVFTSEELTHLGDVQVVISGARRMTTLSLLIFILVLIAIYFVYEQRSVSYLRTRLIWAGGVSLLFALFVLLSIAFNFDSFFTGFHRLFFEAGTWQFSPSSNLILLYPEPFFVDMGTAIMKTFLLGANFFIGLGLLLFLQKKWQR